MDDRNDIDINANGKDQEEEKQEGTDIGDLDNDVDGGELVEETKPDIEDPIEENVISQENLLPLVEELFNDDFSNGVSNKDQLILAMSLANDKDVIILKDDYIFENVEIKMPDLNLTIDGQGQVWDIGSIKIVNGVDGSLTIKDLKFTGRDEENLFNESNKGRLILEDMEFYDTKGAIKLKDNSST